MEMKKSYYQQHKVSNHLNKWIDTFSWERHKRGIAAVPLLSGVFLGGGAQEEEHVAETLADISVVEGENTEIAGVHSGDARGTEERDETDEDGRILK